MPTSLNQVSNPWTFDTVKSPITLHILDVVWHLKNTTNHTPSQLKNSLAADTNFDLLLIGNLKDLAQFRAYILETLNNKHIINHVINIDTLSIEDFIALPFNKRYDLGCLIYPLNISSTDLHATQYQTAQIDPPKLNLVALKLRDLFAQQSLLFMPNYGVKVIDSDDAITVTPDSTHHLPNNLTSSTIPIQFNALGYTLSTMDSDKHNTEAKEFIQCWQFNLYDYKPQPDWLNAKYWANPENFDKFRW